MKFFRSPLVLLLATFLTSCVALAPDPVVRRLGDAIWREQYEEARRLLISGVDPNGEVSEGQPLIVAISRGDHLHRAKYLELLLEFGGRVDIENNRGERPLYGAALAGDVSSIRLLAKRGADIEASNCYGETPLTIASDWGRLGAVRTLLELGTSVNHVGSRRTLSCVKFADVAGLILMGVPPHGRGASGARRNSPTYENEMPALSYAVRQSQYEVALFLLQHGADPNAKSAEFGTTPLMFLARSCTDRGRDSPITAVSLAEALLRAGARLDAHDNADSSAEALARDGGCKDILPVLGAFQSPTSK